MEIPNPNNHPLRFESDRGFWSLFAQDSATKNDEQHAKAMDNKGFLMKPVAIGDLATMVRKGLDEAKDSIHAYVIQSTNIHRPVFL